MTIHQANNESAHPTDSWIWNAPDVDEKATMMFVDMANSTAITATTPEASWLANFGMALEAISREISSVPEGMIVKFLGDGLMAKFSGETAATAAINTAIRIQEVMKELNKHKIDCVFSVGIATGRVRPYGIGEEKTDYLGDTVNKAARLCDAGSSKATIVDSATVDDARLGSIKSDYGEIIQRTGRDYLSEEISTSLKGIHDSQAYYEIVWEIAPYGISGQHHSEAVKTSRSEPKSSPDTTASNERPFPAGPHHGTIKSVNTNSGFMFIEDKNGQSYYTQPGYFVDEAEPEVGDEVFFHARPPLSEGKAPVASSVIVLNEYYRGPVVKNLENILFVKLKGDASESHDVIIFKPDYNIEFNVGLELDFKLEKRFDKKSQRLKASGSEVEIAK